jgi:two-component system CheB/CheR fusion protein
MIYENKLLQMNKKAIKLLCIKPDNAGQFIVTTDILKFRQIFTNLLDNALKFTDSGEISFGYSSHNESILQCFVADTGIGIDAKDQKLIFEMFRQVNTPLQRTYGGTGLGLAICKGNSNLLGGDISVESSPGKGSKFYFSIFNNDNVLIKEEVKKRIRKSLTNVWTDKSILIVEDDVFSIEFLKHLLSPTGIKLNIARNGKEAEEYYSKLEEMNMVILDLRLPDANGLNIMKQIKILKKEIPVIAQTAFAMEDDKYDCMKAGFDDFIAKPINYEELLNLISSYID